MDVLFYLCIVVGKLISDAIKKRKVDAYVARQMAIRAEFEREK